MSVPFCRVYWKDTSVAPPNNVKEITDCVSWTDKHAINVKSNTAEIIVKNVAPLAKKTEYFDSYKNLRFSVGGTSITGASTESDDIEIYLGTAPVTKDNSTDLLCSMSITSVEPRYDESQRSFRLTCADKTFLLLSHYVVGDYPKIVTGAGSARTNELVQMIIRQWTRKTDTTTDDIEVDTYVDSTKSDGSTLLPYNSYSSVYKPIYEVLSELSQQQYTGDIRPFIFWVDKENYLHWIYPTQTGGTELNEEVDQIYSIKIGKSQADEVNMVIFSAGKDKNGVNILDYDVNTEAGSTLRMAYYDWSDITANMKLPTVIASQWDAWDNDTVRANAKIIGHARCLKIFAGKGLIWKGTIVMKGNRDFNAGDLIKLTSQSCGFNDYRLRIMDIIQDITKGNWQTTLEVEEDPKELVI